jgi:tetratricopeptide (TPR) repeat protein
LRRDEARFDDQGLPLEARLAPPLPDFGEAGLAAPERVRRALGEGLRALEKGDDFACRAAEAKLASWSSAGAQAAGAFLVASRLLADGDAEGAYRALAAPLGDGTVRDGYDVRRLLAEAAFRSGRLDAAELQIRRAISLDPERAEPRRFLARLVVDVADRPSPIKVEVLRGLLTVDPTEGARAKLLVEQLGRLGDDKGVLEAEPFARFTDPSDPLVPWREGRAARALGQNDRALAAFERALAFGPPAALAQAIEKAVAEIRAAPHSEK